MKKQFFFMALAAVALVACKGGEAPETDMPDWYYTGGKLGTTTNTSSMTFRQPTPATEDAGLGTYVRSSCQHCHPNYSHGTSVPEGTYDASNVGNGTLLVVINPATQAYVPWLAGMPQLFGAAPFPAPLDPDQITVTWKTVTDEHGNKFEDGETYELRYPEVHMPNTAVYVYNQGYRDPDGLLESQGYEVKLENTIGVYGSGLLDAIPDQDIIDQYAKEAADGKLKNGLNPAFWDGGFATSGYYKNDPQWGPKRFTYALTRGPIMDAAGANAIWNITNVTRSDRKYHYLDLNGTIYAEYASKDPEVQTASGKTEDELYNYLTSKELPAEMTDEEFTQVMVWHRGLAVPAARGVNDEKVLRGKELFTCSRKLAATTAIVLHGRPVRTRCVTRITSRLPLLCRVIRIKRFGRTRIWFSISYAWRTISAPVGAVLPRSGVAVCIEKQPAICTKHVCTTLVLAM